MSNPMPGDVPAFEFDTEKNEWVFTDPNTEESK